MKDNVVFYSKEQVDEALWILNTPHLNHGIANMWAYRIMIWYTQFYNHVIHLKRKLYNVPLKEYLCRIVNQIKEGKLYIKDTPYYHPLIAD